MKDFNHLSLAFDIRTIFEREHEMLNDLSFPFFYQFPKDCCQSASIFLGVCLKQFFPDAEVKIVRGTTRGDDEYHHYWVEVDKRIYDLTLDQFEKWLEPKFSRVSRPIYSEKRHPLAKYYFYKKKENITDAFVYFITGYANLNEVLNAFNYCYIELRKLGWFSDFKNLKRDLY